MSLIASAPPAVIFVNDEINLQIQQWLVRQLKIDIVMDGYEFNNLIALDSSFTEKVKLSNRRLMVLIDFIEQHDRSHADIVAYIKNGLIYTEKNKFGPPISAYQVLKIHWGQFGVFVKKHGPGNLENGCKRCCPKKKCILVPFDPKRSRPGCGCNGCGKCSGCK